MTRAGGDRRDATQAMHPAQGVATGVTGSAALQAESPVLRRPSRPIGRGRAVRRRPAAMSCPRAARRGAGCGTGGERPWKPRRASRRTRPAGSRAGHAATKAQRTHRPRVEDPEDGGGFIQGYNAQVAVDAHAQVIVAQDVTPMARTWAIWCRATAVGDAAAAADPGVADAAIAPRRPARTARRASTPTSPPPATQGAAGPRAARPSTCGLTRRERMPEAPHAAGARYADARRCRAGLWPNQTPALPQPPRYGVRHSGPLCLCTTC